MKKWTIEDSRELYNINGWGTSYFGVNDRGDMYVTPCKDNVQIDLRDVMDELQLRDVTPPVLLRFPDILDNRIEKTSSCFKKAAEEYNYKGENFIVYPIKVNQMQPVVEEIISHGRKFNLGLECGSKPELHAVIAVQCQSDSIIVCNGYKDQSYIVLPRSLASSLTSASASSSLLPDRASGRRAVATHRSSALERQNCFRL